MEHSLKIVHVIFSLSSGGAERMVLNLCNEQVKNHKVVLITILKKNEHTDFYFSQLNENVEYINLNSHKGLRFSFILKILNLLRHIQPNVVHFHLNTVVYGFLPALVKSSRVKFVHTLHNVAELSVGFKSQRRINKWFYKSKRIIPVALSAGCAESIHKMYGIQNVSVVLNGVPPCSLSENALAAANFVQSLRSSTQSLVYIHVARFDKQKNQELLWSTFNELINLDKDIHLIVLGRDYPDYKFPQIHFIGEVKNPLDYVAQADAMVLSSWYEGIPMSVLEAFSAGVPVISTPAGGMNDLVINEENGLLSDDFTIQSYKATVSRMNDLLRKKRFEKDKIISRFNENYSIRSAAKAYVEIYDNNVTK